jgi:hypothetical protein
LSGVAAERKLRLAAAVLLLAGLGYLGAKMVPAYLRNLEFQRALEALVQEADLARLPSEAVAAAVVDRAARLGLPVRMSQVRLERGGSGLRITVRYTVPVELTWYSVDLHFRAAAGAR